MKWTSDDIKLVEKFIEIKNKGYYVDGGQLTEVYNRVLEKNANITNCGSCLRQRVNELEGALDRFKKLSETLSKEEPRPSKGLEGNEVVKAEENKAVKKAGKNKR